MERTDGYRCAAIAVAMIVSLLAGCATALRPDAAEPRGHATLVLPPARLADHWDVPPYEDTWDWGWENFRNDDALGVGGSSGIVQSQHVEIRGVDRRSTQNGRVTESSRTTTRTLRRGWLFSP